MKNIVKRNSSISYEGIHAVLVTSEMKVARTTVAMVQVWNRLFTFVYGTVTSGGLHETQKSAI